MKIWDIFVLKKLSLDDRVRKPCLHDFLSVIQPKPHLPAPNYDLPLSPNAGFPPHSEPGGRLNKKDGLTRYGNSHVKDKTS